MNEIACPPPAAIRTVSVFSACDSLFRNLIICRIRFPVRLLTVGIDNEAFILFARFQEVQFYFQCSGSLIGSCSEEIIIFRFTYNSYKTLPVLLPMPWIRHNPGRNRGRTGKQDVLHNAQSYQKPFARENIESPNWQSASPMLC